MKDTNQYANRLNASAMWRSVWRMVFQFSSMLLLSNVYMHSQCPNTGQTTVTKPNQGTGYNFFRFQGDSSFRYFLDGKTFSLNAKDDPGKTFIFIDDFVYELTLVETAALAQYVKSSKDVDILRAQAKHQQDYFKQADRSMVITDYGPSSRKNPDGSDDRLFYLWKKQNPSGKDDATQFIVSTLIKDGVVVLSVIPRKASFSEEDVFLKIQKYTSHFNLLSNDLCARVLAAPPAPK